MPRVLVVIKSCHKYAERRAAQRASWLQSLKWDRLYVVGDGPAIKEENLVQFKVPDGWGNMAPKVAKGCEWGAAHDYDFIFICDDDTYAVPARLEAAIPEGQDYVGWYRSDGGTLYNWPYLQGSGYWLSKRAAAILAQSPIMGPGIPDDVAAGKVLFFTGGMQISHDNRYYPGPIGALGRPLAGNEYITTHKCLPANMKEIHELWLKESGQSCQSPSTFAAI